MRLPSPSGEAKNSREAAASREFFYHKLYVRIGTL